MAKVITFSRTFPSYHPKAGQPTYFVEKVWKSLGGPQYEHAIAFAERSGDYTSSIAWGYRMVDGIKHHTIRAGHRWKAGDWFSPRVWSGRPYASKMIQFAPDIQIKKVWDFELSVFGAFDDVLMCIDGQPPKQKLVPVVAENDGLTLADFGDWFTLSADFKKKKVFDGQIICWNESIEYTNLKPEAILSESVKSSELIKEV